MTDDADRLMHLATRVVDGNHRRIAAKLARAEEALAKLEAAERLIREPIEIWLRMNGDNALAPEAQRALASGNVSAMAAVLEKIGETIGEAND